jgi:hypothetical protein
MYITLSATPRDDYAPIVQYRTPFIAGTGTPSRHLSFDLFSLALGLAGELSSLAFGLACDLRGCSLSLLGLGTESTGSLVFHLDC